MRYANSLNADTVSSPKRLCISVMTQARSQGPRNDEARNMATWRAREREPIWESGGFAPSGVQGQSPWSGGPGGFAPLKLTRFCRYKTEFLS